MRAFLAVCIFLTTSPVIASERWPAVRQAQATFDITWNAPRIDIDFPVFDESGNTAYRLICRGGTDQAYLDALSEGPNGINYVGPLTCILNEGNRETEATLLAENDWRPWHSRGQFSLPQLIGACGAYPEHGKVRSFRLRGFELKLDLSDTSAAPDLSLRSMFKVTVMSDARILSQFSQPSGYAAPRGDCTKIVKEPPLLSAIALNRMRYR